MSTTHSLYLNSYELAEALKAAVLFLDTSAYKSVHHGDGIAAVCLHLDPATNEVDVVGLSEVAAYRKRLEALLVEDRQPSLPNNQLLIPREVVSILLKYTPRRAVRPISHFEVTVPEETTNRQEVKFTGPDGSSHIFQTLGLHYPDYVILFKKGVKMKAEQQPTNPCLTLMSEQLKRLTKVVGKEQLLKIYFGKETFCYIELGVEEKNNTAQILMALCR